MTKEKKKELLIFAIIVIAIVALFFYFHKKRKAENTSSVSVKPGSSSFNIGGNTFQNSGVPSFPSVNSGGAGACGSCSGQQFQTPDQIAASLDNSQYYKALQDTLDSLQTTVNSGNIYGDNSYQIPPVGFGGETYSPTHVDNVPAGLPGETVAPYTP